MSSHIATYYPCAMCLIAILNFAICTAVLHLLGCMDCFPSPQSSLGVFPAPCTSADPPEGLTGGTLFTWPTFVESLELELGGPLLSIFNISKSSHLVGPTYPYISNTLGLFITDRQCLWWG